MKKLFILPLFLFTVIGTITAQKALTNGGGPLTELLCGSHEVVVDNDDSFVIYNGPRTSKQVSHTITTYDKKSHTVTTHTIDLPNDVILFTAQDAGEEYFVTYGRSEKRSVTFETARITKDDNAAVTPEARLTLEMDARGDVENYMAASPDKSKRAVVLFATDRKSIADEFHLFVFNEKGEEILYQQSSPELSGNLFDVSDLQVTNDGEVTILLTTGDGKRKAFTRTDVQLIVCNKEGNKSYSSSGSFGIIQSMKMCLLKNGNYFIGGYYAEKNDAPTSGCFSMIFNTQTHEFEATQNYELDDQHKAKHSVSLITGNRKFQTLCKAIHELENGNVIVIGEHQAGIKVLQNNLISYIHYANDIIYQKYNTKGEKIADGFVPKDQNTNEMNRPLSGFKYFGWNDRDFGISFASFVNGNDVYVLYTDNMDNLLSAKGGKRAIIAINKNNCLAISKLEENGPVSEIAILHNKNKQTFSSFTHFDGKTVYFSMSGKKVDTIEHFDL